MTTLNVTLSPTLQSQLGQPGVNAYAVYFLPDGTAVWTTLVDDGAVEGGGTEAISLPVPTIAGKVYFIIQSTTGPGNLPQQITTQSMLNDQNAATYDFRYDSIEATLQGSSSDVGNLTSVTGFGLPMEISVPYDNGTTGTVGYGITADQLVDQIQAIDPAKTYTQTYTSGPLAGQFRAATSPASQGQSGSPFSATDWSGYVTSLEGPQASAIELTGFFNGAVDAANLWHNGGYFAYQLQWDATRQVFWLAPEASSQIKGYIQLTPADLENSIYATDGSAGIYASETDATPYETINTGANNQWGKVLLTLLTGFAGGFFGETGASPNPQVTTGVDLDQNANWEPIYAFGKNLASTVPAGYQTSDPYSQIFYSNTNSYGSGYSDALMSQYATGGPQISLAEPGSQTNVPAIDVTIFADGEQPTGYVAPTLDDYIAAPAGGYTPAEPSTAGLNIAMVFGESLANNVGVVLDSAAVVTLRLLTSDAGGVPVWSNVTFDGSMGGAAGLWQIWAISGNATTGYTAAPLPTPVTEPTGTLLVSNLPAGQSGVGWYQVQVGQKVFNLYTTMSGGQFENPGYAGQSGALAVDGLAKIAAPAVPDQTVNTFSLLFFNSDTSTIDPSLLVVNTSQTAIDAAFGATQPDAPVAGTLSGDVFAALPGQDQPDTNTITTGQTSVAFAWTGENDAAGTAGWIAGYTNKADAGDVVRVTLDQGSSTVAVLTATAGLDGEWQTGAVSLAAGTYTVEMQEYQAADTGFADPLTPLSQSLTLTETSGGPPCFVAGTRIATRGGDVPVEGLAIGDQVLTIAGKWRPIRWIGRRSYAGRFLASTPSAQPIHFRVGSLGDGLPRRDLLVSPGHAMFLDGLLVPARALVNGVSIVRERGLERVDYFHVELDSHDVLLAECAPSESFLDDDSRGMFHNAAEFAEMYPDAGWPEGYCAPRVEQGPALEAIRRRLAALTDLVRAA